MHRWETRMLRHYLERGVSKAELSRRFRVSRRTIYSWIASGDLDRDLVAGGTRYSPRPRRAHKLDPYKLDHRGPAVGVSPVIGAAAVRREPRGRLCGQLRPGPGLRPHGPAARSGRARQPLRDAAGPAGPGGFRQFHAAVGAAPRPAGGARPFPDPVAAVLSPADDGGAGSTPWR